MQREQLEHIIRAAGFITNQYDFIVIGSQSILGAVRYPPVECLMSMEADIYPYNVDGDIQHLLDKIDASIGEGSAFHVRFGVYAQGVDSHTAVLPAGWEKRLTALQNEGTDGRAAWCIDPTDLFLAKSVANREKDGPFNKALLRAGLVAPAEALTRANDLPRSAQDIDRVKSRIRRWVKEAGL